MNRNRDSTTSPETKTISDLFSWARVLKWGRKREKQRKRRLGIGAITIRFTVRGWNAILTEKHSGKTKQVTNLSVSSFKGKLKFFRFKIVKYETRAFKKEIEIKPIPILFISLTANNHFWYCCPLFASEFMHNSTGYVIKQLVHAFSCALSSYGALGKFGEHSELNTLLTIDPMLIECQSVCHLKWILS